MENNQAIATDEGREKIKEIISSLPTETGWGALEPLCFYQGFWWVPSFLENMMLAQQRFSTQPGDIFVCSIPKSGTTWIKALTFATINRHAYDDSSNPLLFKGPHDCLISLELGKFDRIRESGVPLIATHAPYPSLPKSALDSDACKIVYICRDPKDTFVSMALFAEKWRVKKDEHFMQQAFELFCEGKSLFGPIWNHILGYWKASLERPNNVIFLKYEDLSKESAFHVKKLAEFMGYPFSPEEEQDGTLQKIIDLCSFENLSNLDVNRTGMLTYQMSARPTPNRDFFRKGKVGDWRNHLTPEMAKRLDNITEEQLNGTGLTFINSS